MRVRTSEADVVIHVFTRVGDTCEVFVSAVARVCVRYCDVLHVYTYTMLDSTTIPLFLKAQLRLNTLQPVLLVRSVAILSLHFRS